MLAFEEHTCNDVNLFCCIIELSTGVTPIIAAAPKRCKVVGKLAVEKKLGSRARIVRTEVFCEHRVGETIGRGGKQS